MSNVAWQSIRYILGLRATAVVATAAFLDAGLVIAKDKLFVVDHNKVKRAQVKVVKNLQQ